MVDLQHIKLGHNSCLPHPAN